MIPGKENTQRSLNRNTDPQNVQRAHDAADKDIAADPDLAENNDPNNDLDEGELARLGEDKPDIV